jgi:fermentation-respiration switch protein FrsA (DUF1100 family)
LQPAQSLDEVVLFQPTKFPVGNWTPEGLTFEDVYFSADDGVRLHAWYCPHEKPRAFVLYAHGNAGNLSDRAGVLRLLHDRLSLAVLIFDYRGYGRSEGAPTVEGALKDARAARKCLAQRAGIPEAEVVLLGRSLGGAVAVQLAAEGGARGLVLESTFSSLRDAAASHFGRLLSKVIQADRLNSVEAIRRYKGPLFQSHGDADTVVPYSLGRKLFDAANEPKRFVTIRGGNHNDPQPLEYYQQLNDFIGSLPAPQRGE